MNGRNETSQANQTEFVDQVALMDNKPIKFFKVQDFRNNKSLLPFYILIGLFFLFVFLLILRAVFQPKPLPNPVFEQNEVVVESGPLNKRVYELREELKEHNPTKQSLPFPQVDLEFNIY